MNGNGNIRLAIILVAIMTIWIYVSGQDYQDECMYNYHKPCVQE